MENLLESIEFKWAMIGLVSAMALFILCASLKFVISSIIYFVNFLFTTKANISIPFHVIFLFCGSIASIIALILAMILSINNNNMAGSFLAFAGIGGFFTLLLSLVIFSAPKI